MTNPASIPIHGPQKVTLTRALAALPESAMHAQQAENLVRELWLLCRRPKVNVNPLVPYAIAMHETGGFTSDLWNFNFNPCGLKTKAGNDYAKFINGVDAARALAVHVLMYADGKAGNLGKYRSLDPRASIVVAKGWGGSVETLADFRGKWADDERWPEKVVARYNTVRTTELEPAYEPDYIEITNRVVPTGRINTPNLALVADHIAVHQTGNTARGAGAYMHNQFLWAGGGPENVSFHWAIDDSYVYQNVNTDMVTWQAGDGYYGRGNRRAESYELCVNADGDYVQTIHNAAHHIAKRLTARGWYPDETRLRPGQHRNFSGKWCPAQILSGTAGINWNDFVSLVRFYYERM